MRAIRFINDLLPARHDTVRIIILALGSSATFFVARLAAGDAARTALGWACLALAGFVAFGCVVESVNVAVYGRRVWPAALAPLHWIVNSAAHTNELKPRVFEIDEWIHQEEGEETLRSGDEVHSLTCDLLTIEGRISVQKTVAKNLDGGARYYYYLPKDQDMTEAVGEVARILHAESGLTKEVLKQRLFFYEIGTPVIYNFSYMRTFRLGEWVSWYLLTPPDTNHGEFAGKVVVHSLQGANPDVRQLLAKLRRWPAGRSISLDDHVEAVQ